MVFGKIMGGVINNAEREREKEREGSTAEGLNLFIEQIH